MGHLAIRWAEPGDIRQIQRLYTQLDSHHAELLPDVFQAAQGDARSDEVVLKGVGQPDAGYLLAVLDGQIVGFLNLRRAAHPKYPMFRPREFALIENAVVDKRRRGQGVGTALFQAAIAWAKESGLRYVQTTVWDANAGAREFYLTQGFRPMTLRLELDTAARTEAVSGEPASKGGVTHGPRRD